MKLCKEDLLVNIFKFRQGIFDVFGPQEDTADFRSLQGKLEPRTLINTMYNEANLVQLFFFISYLSCLTHSVIVLLKNTYDLTLICPF